MASTIKVDNVQNQPGTNIVNKCGTTITLGASGDTVSLASGASQTGFGRTGTVDWETTPKTATFTAVSGKGYFCNTTSGGFEVDLPAGSAGAIVSIQDYNNTFDDNALTVDPNGSEKINGGAAGAVVTFSTEGLGVTFVYVDSTVGWRSIHSNEYATAGESFMTATGGNATVTVGDYKTHIFTGPGTFTVCSISNTPANNKVDYVVVAGGGGGYGGGAGAGGFRIFSTAPGSNSPLNNSGASPNTEITVTATGYPIAVGGGGAGSPASPAYCGPAAAAGVASTFSTVTSAGGGRAGAYRTPGCAAGAAGGTGGSGAGGGYFQCGGATAPGGTGNTPPVSPVQGHDGGPGRHVPGVWANVGGGGGAATAGTNGSPGAGGDGGSGSYIADPFVGPTAPSYGTPGPVSSTRYFAGGGSGGGPAGGGAGGGGPTYNPKDGTVNTGGGAGGHTPAGSGGSGIVMIRYTFH